MQRIIFLSVVCLITCGYLQNWTAAQTSMIGTMPTQRQLEGAQMTLGRMSFTAQPMEAPRTFREHDLVTVIVNKDWRSTSKGTMERKRKMQSDYGITKWVSFNGLFGIGASKFDDGAPALGGKIDSKFKNEGTMTRREQLEFKITCQVESILENGVLYLEGTDKDLLAEEGKIIELTGYVRPQDIQPDNTIKGELVYQREINEIPSGSVQDSIRRNWGQKLVDRYSPF
ncbi:MAG: flagellar basal body L-ring protein FlgH [Planctomycetaceae bacterium]|nr:flagellar basal body L-ring protein FlgH [Planctomycetaceae bacterium]